MSTRRQRGFTLVEVMVAFAILAVSLSALYSVFNSSMLRSRRDAQLSEATLLAQSLLARGAHEWADEPAPITGQWQEFQYRVTQLVEQTSVGQQPYTVPTVQVLAEVSWSAAGRTRQIELSSLRIATSSP